MFFKTIFKVLKIWAELFFLTGAALEIVYLGNDGVLHCNNLFHMCLLGI